MTNDYVQSLRLRRRRRVDRRGGVPDRFGKHRRAEYLAMLAVQFGYARTTKEAWPKILAYLVKMENEAEAWAKRSAEDHYSCGLCRVGPPLAQYGCNDHPLSHPNSWEDVVRLYEDELGFWEQ